MATKRMRRMATTTTMKMQLIVRDTQQKGMGEITTVMNASMESND